MNYNYFRSLVQYLNIMGGVYLLDFMDEKEIKYHLKARLKYYDEYGSDVVKGIKKKKVNINSVLRVISKNTNQVARDLSRIIFTKPQIYSEVVVLIWYSNLILVLPIIAHVPT